MYPELNSTVDKTVVRGLFYAMACWLMTNTLAAFAVYFDSSIMGNLSAIFQGVLMLFVIIIFSRWLKIIAEKQKALFIQIRQLTTDEYAAMSYVIPLIISPAAQLLYSFSSRELSWQKRSETGLLVHLAIIYLLHMALIRKFVSFTYLTNAIKFLISYHAVVPGRILQMFAVTKANLLRLKQIFVRYVSHEIRYTLIFRMPS